MKVGQKLVKKTIEVVDLLLIKFYIHKMSMSILFYMLMLVIIYICHLYIGKMQILYSHTCNKMHLTNFTLTKSQLKYKK